MGLEISVKVSNKLNVQFVTNSFFRSLAPGKMKNLPANLLTNRAAFARIGPINRLWKDQGMSLMHRQLHISANKQDKRSKKPAERSG
jgi:hypothetical protein